MGGKQKAQRTKGNVRPSSSSRAAESLESSGGGVQGFIGFGSVGGASGTKSNPGYVPMQGIGDDVDNSVDANLRMVLRKLSKRDSTTKQKALQELTDLFADKTNEEVKTVLPFWPRIYSKLVMDDDRRVREHAQLAFEQLILQCRRDMAPYLKALMPHWLLAINDSYAPVSSSAKKALHVTFNAVKQKEALAFCRTEIMQHIEEMLLIQNIVPNDSSSDKESYFHRVMSACLLSWKQFMSSVPPESQKDVTPIYHSIMKSAKFWKLAKHTSAMIRSAFYGALSAFIQNNTDTCEDYLSKICPCVMYNLNESEPICVPAQWEAILYMLKFLQSCWSHVNVRKGVLPPLWSLFRAGFHGTASIIGPNLLIFLSKIPEEHICLEFYQEYFTNLRNGLALDKVSVSSSETAAIVTAMVECIRYCLHKHREDSKLCHYIVHEQLLTLLEASIADSSSSLSNSPLYSLLGKFFTALDASTTVDNKELLAQLWTSVTEICERYINLEDDNSENYLKRLGMLVTKLHIKHGSSMSTHKTNAQKKGRIKFADDTTQVEPIGDNESPPTVDAQLYPTPLYYPDSHLQTLVHQLCVTSYKRPDSLGHMQLFRNIFSVYTYLDVVAVVYTHCLEDTYSGGWLCVVKDMIYSRLMSAPANFRTVYVKLFGVVYRKADLDEQIEILAFIASTTHSTKIVHEILRELLSTSSLVSLKDWLHGPQYRSYVHDLFLNLTTNLSITVASSDDLDSTDAANQNVPVTHSTQDIWDMLKLCLSVFHEKEPLAGSTTIKELISSVRATIPNIEEQDQLSNTALETRIMFVCKFTDILCSSMKGPLLYIDADKLLASLFKFHVQMLPCLSAKVLLEVKQCWLSGLSTISTLSDTPLIEGFFINHVISIVKENVETNTHTLESVDQLMNLITEISFTISIPSDDTSHNGNIEMSEQFISQLYCELTPTESTQCLVGPTVRSDIVLMGAVDTEAATDYNCLPKFLVPALLNSTLINKLYCHESSRNDNLPVVKAELSYVMDLFYALSYCNNLISQQTQSVSESVVGQLCKHLTTNASSIMSKSTTAQKIQLVELLVKRSESFGKLWSCALSTALSYMTDLPQSDITKQYSISNLASENHYNTMKAFVPLLSKQELSDSIRLLTRAIGQLDAEDIDVAQVIFRLSLLSKLVAQLVVVDPKALDAPQPTNDLSAPNNLQTELMSVMNCLQILRQKQDEMFAFDSNISDLSWPCIVLNCCVMSYFTVMIKACPTELKQYWDFILCSTVPWVQSFDQSAESLDQSMSIQLFTITVCRLVSEAHHCLTESVQNNSDSSLYPEELYTEWVDFFAEPIYTVLLKQYVELIESSFLTYLPSAAHDSVIKELSNAVASCPTEQLKAHLLSPKISNSAQYTDSSDSIETLINHISPHLSINNRSLQVTAYHLLVNVLPELSLNEATVKENEDIEVEEEAVRSPPTFLIDQLQSSMLQLTGVTDQLDFGVPLSVTSEHYSALYTYLLTWKLVISSFRQASAELRSEYACYLRHESYITNLMKTLYHIMPNLSSACTLTDQQCTALFTEENLLKSTDESSTSDITHLACQIYYNTLKGLPAVIRLWWNGQDQGINKIVNHYTSQYVSSVLVKEEFSVICNNRVNLTNMTIKARVLTGEVIATYNIDEVSMELFVYLTKNHPLGMLKVDSGKRIGVTSAQWRKWMLQLTIYLHHQNGTIVDGLSLWKNNIDNKFEGIEECMICFSVIHATNFHLPKLQCRVCKKKYHVTCLHKWFSTSNKSTCPLCRNIF